MQNTDNWTRMVFKGNKVWAETEADGSILVSAGRVKIKYNLKHDQEYLVNPSNIEKIDESGLSEKTLTPEKKMNKQPLPEIIPAPQEKKNEEHFITVYTDGASSGNPGPSGIGVYFSCGRHEREISRYIGESTNNIAELEAIRTALAEIKNRDMPVRIYSDSSYAIGVISKGWKARKNQDLIAEIKKLLSSFKKVDFIKVEGHSGLPGNEKADSLATGAIENRIK